MKINQKLKSTKVEFIDILLNEGDVYVEIGDYVYRFDIITIDGKEKVEVCKIRGDSITTELLEIEDYYYVFNNGVVV